MEASATPCRWLAVVALGAALLLGIAVAQGARAHEFALALVSAAQGDAVGRDVVDGFRLAVEESPDVSHPPGTGPVTTSAGWTLRSR